MKNIFISSKGSCDKRQLDANKICSYLSKNGHKIVNNPNDADIIIFVTCSFNDERTYLSLKRIKEFQKYTAEIIVAGCLPTIEPEKLSKIFKGKILSTETLDKNPDLIDSFFPENKIKFIEMEDVNIKFQTLEANKPKWALIYFFRRYGGLGKHYLRVKNHILKNLLGEKTYAYLIAAKKPFHIRVSWGCTSNCSYCAIKKAVGKFHSKPIEQCIKEFKKGLSEGYSDFVITADNIGVYGIDIESSFPDLLDRLTQIPDNYNISIQDVDPRWIVRYMDDIERILKRGKIVRMDIPIQSASSRLLKLMNRYSDVEKIKEAFIRLNKAYPDLVINTTYLMGFPTETDEDMKKTLSFIRDVNCNDCTIFNFSCKEGTEAEKIKPKISIKEKIKRYNYVKKFFKRSGYNLIYQHSPYFLTISKKIKNR